MYFFIKIPVEIWKKLMRSFLRRFAIYIPKEVWWCSFCHDWSTESCAYQHKESIHEYTSNRITLLNKTIYALKANKKHYESEITKINCDLKKINQQLLVECGLNPYVEYVLKKNQWGREDESKKKIKE